MGDPLWPEKERIIRKWYIEGKPILDVGCNEGKFTSRFNEIKHSIDIDSKLLSKARKRGIIVFKRDLNKPFRLNKFSNIFCLEVLEHLVNPEVCLKSCYESLNKDGRFFVSVPYLGIVKRTVIALFFFDKFYGHKTKHIRFYSPNYMKKMLHRTGFKILKEYKMGRFFPVYFDILFVCTKK